MNRYVRSSSIRLLPLLLAACLLSACATGPKIRVNQDQSADYGKYHTFGFPAETGTDRGGYSTLLTSYFKTAVKREMESRGYKYAEDNPDLLVNFFVNIRHESDTRPRMSMGYGYYGYRYGLYTAWPLYDWDAETVHYRVGTANIDIVDAGKKQLIWEGVAEGQISEKNMDNPQKTVDAVVTQVFARFPGRSRM
jgi:hypothetical protein